MQIDPSRYQHFKVEKRNTLFPLEADMELLDDGRCPRCGKKLKKTLKGTYYCSRHKPSFAIKSLSPTKST